MATKHTHEWSTVIKMKFTGEVTEQQVISEILPDLSKCLDARMDDADWAGKYGFEDYSFEAPRPLVTA